MKTIQIVKPGKAEIIDLPVPEIKSNEVLVKVVSVVTCPHWDMTLFKGTDIFERPGFPKYPVTPGFPGHEMSGDVVAVGSDVKKFKKGDRVATLYTDNVPEVGGDATMGFYCEYINRPEESIALVPDNISYEATASMEMCRHISPYVTILGDVSNMRIGVVGMGPAGLIALQMVKGLGAKEVVVIDIIDERLKLAVSLGVDDTINSSKKEDLDRLVKNPLDGCVDCSGAASGLQTALDYTRGPVSIFGVVHGEAKFTTKHWCSGVYITRRDIPNEHDTKFVLDLWQKGLLDTDVLVSARLPFERYTEAVNMLFEHKAIKVSLHP